MVASTDNVCSVVSTARTAAIAPAAGRAQTGEISLGQRVRDWKTIAGFGVSAAIIAFFVLTARLDPAAIWANVRAADVRYLLLALLVYLGAFIFRGMRWRLLLRRSDLGEGVRLPQLAALVEMIYLSWFVNSIVPAKLGDGYFYLVAVTNSQQASSIALETGQPVLAMGGFMGSDPAMTVERLQQMIANRQVRFVMAGGGGGFRGGNSSVSQWVQTNCTSVDSSEYGRQSGSEFGGLGGPGGFMDGNSGLYNCAAY